MRGVVPLGLNPCTSGAACGLHHEGGGTSRPGWNTTRGRTVQSISLSVCPGYALCTLSLGQGLGPGGNATLGVAAVSLVFCGPGPWVFSKRA